MVRQDRGFDPNLVDLVSCRLNEQTDRDGFSVSVRKRGAPFAIYTRSKDRKSCVSIGSLSFGQLCVYIDDPCEPSMICVFCAG